MGNGLILFQRPAIKSEASKEKEEREHIKSRKTNTL